MLKIVYSSSKNFDLKLKFVLGKTVISGNKSKQLSSEIHQLIRQGYGNICKQNKLNSAVKNTTGCLLVRK